MRHIRHVVPLAAALLTTLGGAAGCDLSDMLEGGKDSHADISGEWAFETQYPDNQGDMYYGEFGSIFLTLDHGQIRGTAYLTYDSTWRPGVPLTGSKSGADFKVGLSGTGCWFDGSVFDGAHTHLVGGITCNGREGSWRGYRPMGPVRIVVNAWQPPMTPGSAYALRAGVRDEAGHWLGRALSFSSSDTSVAAVAPNGIVTLRSVGQAIVTIAAPDADTTWLVPVVPADTTAAAPHR